MSQPNNSNDAVAPYDPYAKPTAIKSPTSGPDRVGQGTAVEMSRAVAEVQASYVTAQSRPRSETLAIQKMRDSCGNPRLAEKAFFRFPRGGGHVTGASIHLARELARIWGNINYGIAELRRDDIHRQSEMLAYAVDLETNARNSVTFIVPHMRDAKGGAKPLKDMRDIYENNANNAARRLRECIFSVLPGWFTDEAKDRCMETNEQGGGDPLSTRIAKAVDFFGQIGVSEKQIEQKYGCKIDDLKAPDVTQLGVIFRSIRNGEVTKDEEFPPETVSAADIKAQANNADKQAEPSPTEESLQQAKASNDQPKLTIWEMDLGWDNYAEANWMEFVGRFRTRAAEALEAGQIPEFIEANQHLIDACEEHDKGAYKLLHQAIRG